MAVFKPLIPSIPIDPVARDRQDPEQLSIENTSLDLDAISQSYSGLMKIKRLLHIAKHCPMLAQDATQYAVEEVKTTFNVGAFQVCIMLNTTVDSRYTNARDRRNMFV